MMLTEPISTGVTPFPTTLSTGSHAARGSTNVTKRLLRERDDSSVYGGSQARVIGFECREPARTNSSDKGSASQNRATACSFEVRPQGQVGSDARRVAPAAEHIPSPARRRGAPLAVLL